MQHNSIRVRLFFFEDLYEHLDNLEYVPGAKMLFNALPAVLQAHLIDIVENEKLPDSAIIRSIK
jgi:hypothetical protein